MDKEPEFMVATVLLSSNWSPLANRSTISTCVLTMDDSVQAQRAQVGYGQQGIASWYGPRFHGRDTASGERFDQNKLTAAHRTLPLGTKAMVTNLRNGKKVKVEINDRGPYARGRILDPSKAAAERLDIESGTTPVRLEVTQEQ